MRYKKIIPVLAIGAVIFLSACTVRPPGLSAVVKQTLRSDVSYKATLQITNSDGYLGAVEVNGQMKESANERKFCADVSISTSGQGYIEDNLVTDSTAKGTTVYLGLPDALKQVADPGGTRVDIEKAQTLQLPTVKGAQKDALVSPLISWIVEDGKSAVFQRSSSNPFSTDGTYSCTLKASQIRSLMDNMIAEPLLPVASLLSQCVDNGFENALSKAEQAPSYTMQVTVFQGFVQSVSLKSSGWRAVSTANADPFTGKVLQTKIDTGLDLELTAANGTSSDIQMPSSAAEYVPGQS